MNAPFWISIALGSVLGSAHCASMCGPFVACYAGQRADEVSSRASNRRAAVGYHAARMATYVTLGMLAGALGTALDDVAARAGVARGAAWLSAALILASAGAQLAATSKRVQAWRERSGLRSRASGKGRGLFRRRDVLVQLGRAPRVVRATGLGLLTPLLPCGFLYSFVLLAAGTGSVLRGAVVMAILWLGTAPALLGVGALTAALSRRWGDRAARSLGVVLVITGVLGLLFRTSLPITTSDDVAASSSSPDSTGALTTPHCH